MNLAGTQEQLHVESDESARTPASPWVAKTTGLSVSHGAQVLFDQISFELGSPELVLLRGENGAGKTTLLNVMGGYQNPDHGRVEYRLGSAAASSDMRPEALARRGLGRMWQDIRLFGSMSVLDNVTAASPGTVRTGPLRAITGCLFAGRRARSESDRAAELLELVGLGDRQSSSCDMLSVGQMKRVALARLLQADARLLLLDEPFAGLDSSAADALAALIRTVVDERSVTVLLTSHDLSPLAGRVDRTWTLSEGSLS